jgi:transcriptional regulator with XRE-family HTH domain
MTVGDRIRKRRLELGLTQDELAERLGYKGRTSVCVVETGGDNVTTTKVKKFAMVLGVSPAYLMGWEEEEGYTNEVPVANIEFAKGHKADIEKAMELYTAYTKASPEVQSAVELILKSAQSKS